MTKEDVKRKQESVVDETKDIPNIFIWILCLIHVLGLVYAIVHPFWAI